jgi:hypothetical protein
LQNAATRVIHTASVAVSLRATIEAAADHVETVTRSENQYNVNAVPVHVRLSMGTGSWSDAQARQHGWKIDREVRNRIPALLHIYSGAMELFCLGNFRVKELSLFEIMIAQVELSYVAS